MNLIIAVRSTVQNLMDGKHEVIRGTWAKNFAGKADIRFFMGDALANFGRTFVQTMRDEQTLLVSDLGDAQAYKTRTICQWMLGKMYAHILIVDVDTYLKSGILLSGYEGYDYAGRAMNGDIRSGAKFPFVDTATNEFFPSLYAWAEGAYGIFLSRAGAAEVTSGVPTMVRDDIYIGQQLGPEVFQGQISAQNINLSEYALPVGNDKFYETYEKEIESL